jgi:hypothetical protein
MTTMYKKFGVNLFVVIVYILLFYYLSSITGGGIAAAAIIPVIILAIQYGLWGGVFTAILVFPINLVLYQIVRGNGLYDTFIGYDPGGYIGHSALVLTGATVGYLRDIRKTLKQTIIEREKTLQELHCALTEIKTLSGLLPICASCKKIRDDKGYWNQIEGYIQKHSEAEFSHSICPECAKKLYPEEYEDEW